jgi:hypothetical protein
MTSPFEPEEADRLRMLMEAVEGVLIDIADRRAMLADIDTRLAELEASTPGAEGGTRLRTEVARQIAQGALLAGIDLGATLSDVENRFRHAKALGFRDQGHRALVVLIFARFAGVLGSRLAADEVAELHRDLTSTTSASRTPAERQALRNVREFLREVEGHPRWTSATSTNPSHRAGG